MGVEALQEVRAFISQAESDYCRVVLGVILRGSRYMVLVPAAVMRRETLRWILFVWKAELQFLPDR